MFPVLPFLDMGSEISSKQATWKQMRRQIIRKPRSPWLFFRQTKQEEWFNKAPPGSTMNDMLIWLSGQWKKMKEDDKEPFYHMYLRDKMRYENELERLTPIDRKRLNQCNRAKKRCRAQLPKHPVSPFFHFCQDERPKLKQQHPELTFAETGKMLGQLWGCLSPELKQQYVLKGEQDKRRYRSEVKKTVRERQPKKLKSD